MAEYIDGFVVPVQSDRLEEYEEISRKCSVIWLEHGATDYRECQGDDMNIEGVRSFNELAGAGEWETVMFAWAIFPSKEARDAANEKIMVDTRLKELMDPENPPFDCTRMAFGGFHTLVHAAKEGS